MTYNVFGGTLSLTQSINQSLQFILSMQSKRVAISFLPDTLADISLIRFRLDFKTFYPVIPDER